MFKNWGHVFLLAVTVAAYVGVFQAGFVWDDYALVVYNELIRDPGNIPNFFLMDLWDTDAAAARESGYFRPLILVSMAIDYALFGLEPY